MDTLDLDPNKTPKIDLLSYRMKRCDPTLAEVMAYWESLRIDGALPARADLDPRVISHTLNRAFILDRARPGTVRFRVAGQRLNELMGMEVRGMPVRAFFDLLDRRKLMDNVEACFTTPAKLEMDLVSEDVGQARLTGRMLILPMLDHEGNVNKALGCLVTQGAVGNPPRRFKLGRHNLTPIDVTDPQPAAPLRQGFAEARTLFRTKRSDQAPQTAADPDRLEGTQVPYLSIVRH